MCSRTATPTHREPGALRHVVGDVGPAGSFDMFRRAKLMLGAIEPAVIAAAHRPGGVLVATLGLTDAKGGPLCARVVPPTVVWSAEGDASS